MCVFLSVYRQILTLAAKVTLLLQVVVAILTGGARSTAGVWFTVTLTSFLCTLRNTTQSPSNVAFTVCKSERNHKH